VSLTVRLRSTEQYQQKDTNRFDDAHNTPPINPSKQQQVQQRAYPFDSTTMPILERCEVLTDQTAAVFWLSLPNAKPCRF
jgi:hypothetical protein